MKEKTEQISFSGRRSLKKRPISYIKKEGYLSQTPNLH
ncbi:hypothetical protein M097_0965 [Phocaeicola vulgatus str. 3775 SL(B) 10 (iv)]|uniref:Uncharacterized protein n=1 Tax=Phocaeicola vulgatus str. 3775 SL(B) 10 (iv) TaxID=1339350 RepID=A0A078RBH4_PHOVU|nr:hypothetical protein M098_2687 [Phocaeicola vulgatus str. 3775 SR(B) 19]KDS32763.1 hypothetical protein M097_0965 [Phocaeicola vulgatus str. 3775 SL(B) 10 (iv)]